MVHLTDFRSMVINIAEIALEVAASAIAQIEFRKLRYSINMPAAQATLRAMKYGISHVNCSFCSIGKAKNNRSPWF